MAKKKSRKAPVKIKKETVATIFDCPFCNNKKVVEAKIIKKEMKGTIECRLCESKWACKISSLSEPIDIYSEWIDECDKINK